MLSEENPNQTRTVLPLKTFFFFSVSLYIRASTCRVRKCSQKPGEGGCGILWSCCKPPIWVLESYSGPLGVQDAL